MGVTHGIFTIDTGFQRPRFDAAFLVVEQGRAAFIDCGTNHSVPAMLAALAEQGLSAEAVDWLILTHVHIDHVGRIPALLAAGYRGPILCSEPSAKLLPLVLEDAYRLSISREPVHVAHYLDILDELIISVPFGHWHDVAVRAGVECRIRLQRAGHLLGSAYVAFFHGGWARVICQHRGVVDVHALE